MLTLGAILRSELTQPSEIAVAFETLLDISSKRSYLAVAAIQLIVDHLPKIDSADFSEHIWPSFAKNEAWFGKNAKIEAIWLLLEISTAFPKMPPKSYVQEHLKRKKVMGEALATEIAEVLMVRY